MPVHKFGSRQKAARLRLRLHKTLFKVEHFNFVIIDGLMALFITDTGGASTTTTTNNNNVTDDERVQRCPLLQKYLGQQINPLTDSMWGKIMYGTLK